MSYSQLLSNMKIIASSLYKRGFRAGDVVVIIASNRIEVALMLLSVWKAGGVVGCFTLNLSKGKC
jgi:acyl-CoA synthetase (AMP-forming)/AMP-acid ligase II